MAETHHRGQVTVAFRKSSDLIPISNTDSRSPAMGSVDLRRRALRSPFNLFSSPTRRQPPNGIDSVFPPPACVGHQPAVKFLHSRLIALGYLSTWVLGYLASYLVSVVTPGYLIMFLPHCPSSISNACSPRVCLSGPKLVEA
jgi:hypothetical protein